MSWKSTEARFGKYKNTRERIKTRGPTPCPWGWGAHPLPLGTPPPSWTGCGPPGLHLLRAFFIFSVTSLRGFSGHSENFCFLHMKQHHGNSAENSVSLVSFIQIMQVRVQNKGKSVWKSRYVGDVSISIARSLASSTWDFLPFYLLHTTSTIIFYSTHSAISMAYAHVLRESEKSWSALKSMNQLLAWN